MKKKKKATNGNLEVWYGADFFAVADLETGGLPDISNKRKLTERTDDQDYIPRLM
ncbi:hypothetical protein QS257_03900 [Terrilactibacillus sp. S3-3]|nr:hypothetical protein QS257_03900 [Terrilactibacillus sp. S3-3]